MELNVINSATVSDKSRLPTGATEIKGLPSDKVLQHGAFASTLTADHGDLRQIELHVHAQLRKCILQLVHDRYQLFHAHVAGHCVTAETGAPTAAGFVSADTGVRARLVPVGLAAGFWTYGLRALRDGRHRRRIIERDAHAQLHSVTVPRTIRHHQKQRQRQRLRQGSSTSSTSGKTYGRKRSFVRIRMICSGARARTSARCGRACVRPRNIVFVFVIIIIVCCVRVRSASESGGGDRERRTANSADRRTAVRPRERARIQTTRRSRARFVSRQA